jgi:hypothetical protein
MTTIEDGQRLRRKINRLPRRGDNKRVFSASLKAAILVWIGHMKSEGATEAHCARLLGLTPCYFWAWRNARLASDRPVGVPLASVEPLTRELVPIKVPPSIELTTGVVFVTPHGFRVEGLNLEQAFALLQEFV